MTSRRQLIEQFARFLVVGGLSFAVDFGLFTTFVWLGAPHIPANVVSFSLSVILNYILTRKYVFDASDSVSVRKEFTYYVILNVIALGLNTLVLEICVSLFGLSPIWGKIIATAIVLVYNFISRKILLERLSAVSE